MSLPVPTGWLNEGAWQHLCQTDPGHAVAIFLSSFEGAEMEEDGPNRGRLLREWLPPRAVDGQPYCSAVLVSLADRAGARRMGDSKTWFWPLRDTQALPEAFKRMGAWAGPQCPPRPGAVAVWGGRRGSDHGPGGHADIVLGFEPFTRVVQAVGANLSNTIRVHQFDLGAPKLLGFGYFLPR